MPHSDSAAPAAPGRKRARAEEPTTAPIPNELSLPMQCITRIIKSKLPDGMSVGSETKKVFSKACSLFVLYMTTVAADIAKENNRTNVSAADILAALRDLEFDELVPNVETALAAFRESEKARSIEAAAKKAAKLQRSGDTEDAGASKGEEDGGEANDEAADAEEAAEAAEE